MKIEVFMLTGQNNGEKDVLRAYHRGIQKYFFQKYLNEIPDESDYVKFTKRLKEHDIDIGFNYNESCGEDIDLAVIFGSAKPRDNLHHRVRSNVIANAKNYLMIETPLLNRTIVKQSNHDFYRIGLNGFLNGAGEFNAEDCDERRLNVFNVNLKPWKNPNEDDILILLQLPGDASLRESNHGEWLLDTVEQIRNKTDRKINIRFHPAMSEKGHENFFKDIGKVVFRNYKNITWSDGYQSSLHEDFESAGVCITYSSGSAIDAVINGIPVIAIDEGNFAYPICSKTIDDIDNMYLANDQERMKWIQNLTYHQWNRAEMSNGIAFGHIYPKVLEATDVSS
jgi:hypothetical protein